MILPNEHLLEELEEWQRRRALLTAVEKLFKVIPEHQNLPFYLSKKKLKELEEKGFFPPDVLDRVTALLDRVHLKEMKVAELEAKHEA